MFSAAARWAGLPADPLSRITLEAEPSGGGPPGYGERRIDDELTDIRNDDQRAGGPGLRAKNDPSGNGRPGDPDRAETADQAPSQVKIVIPADHSMVSLLGSGDELLHVIEREFNADIHVQVYRSPAVPDLPADFDLDDFLPDELRNRYGKVVLRPVKTLSSKLSPVRVLAVVGATENMTGPAAIRGPTPGMASAPIPANKPRVPPRTAPDPAPVAAPSGALEFFSVAIGLEPRFSGSSADTSAAEKPAFIKLSVAKSADATVV